MMGGGEIIMFDLDKEMEEYERKKEEERLAFLQKCHDKIKDGRTVYEGLSFIIAHRFRIDESYHGSGFHDVVYDLLNHYVEEVDEDFRTWLFKDDGPFVRPAKDMVKIFPEFKRISNKPRKLVEIANELYGLDLKYAPNEYYGDYVYSYSFDFNSFTPINVAEVVELKQEIATLEKYGNDASELKTKLRGYGFTDEQLEML